MDESLTLAGHEILDGPPNGFGTIVALIERQRPIRFTFESSTDFHFGELHEVKWSKISDYVPYLKAIASLATGRSESDFTALTYLRSISDKFARPGFCLTSRTELIFDEDMRRKFASMLVSFGQSILTTIGSDAQAELFQATISDLYQKEISEISQKFQTAHHGTLVGERLLLRSATGEFLISGRYRRGPYDQLPEPERRTIVGEVDGIRISKRKAYISEGDKKISPVSFDEVKHKTRLIDALITQEKFAFLVETEWISREEKIDTLIEFDLHQQLRERN